jgi:glycosyltransferase involved in cell wall biosynthesis
LQIRKKCGLWVGGTDPYRKGLDIVLQIAKYMKNVEFKIIGSDKDFQSRYNLKIDINDLQNVEFLGKITNEEKIKYYHACDFLIFPSRHEGLAIAPMEALACGLPVIVSDMTGVNEIISNGVEGFIVDNRKLENYVKAITMINKRMGKRARQLALKYDWKRQAGIYAKWFKELVGS